MIRLLVFAFLWLAALPVAAEAQNFGALNTTVSAVSTGSTSAQLAYTQSKYPSAIIMPAPGTSVEIFFALGGSSVAAAVPSPPSTPGSVSLPSGGICVDIGPATYVAAITASGSATVRVLAVSGCTTFSGGSGGGGGSGGNVNLTEINSQTVVTGGVNGSLGVGGLAASGSAVVGYPVLMGGSDGTDARTLATDTGGHLLATIYQGGNSATVNGSGQLSVNCANCSGSGVSQQDATTFVQGTTDMVPIGGIYTTSVSNLTTGQAGVAQLTTDRMLFVNVGKVGGTAAVNGGVAGSFGVGGLAASGAALAGDPVLIAGGNGTDAYTILTDTSGHPIIIGAGAAGTANSGVMTVQGIASMTPVQVSQATAANLNAQVVGAAASGSALAGNPVLAAGSDGTDARDLSTDTSGHLIVEPGNTANTTAWLVTGTGGTFPVSQATASNLNATVVGTGTFAVQATLQASATTPIGKVDPNTIATWGLATVGAGTAPTNMEVGGLIYNSGGVSPSNGQSVALQGDANGYLEVNVKTATGLAQGSTTSGQTGSMVMAAVTTSAPSYTTAQTDPLSLDTAGGLRVTGEAASGSAVSGAPVLAGGTDGTDARTMATDTNGHPLTNSYFNTNNTPTQPHICGSKAYVHVTTNTDTQIVAASGSTNIYICDYEYELTGVGAFYLEKSSTGTCGSPTQIGQVWTGQSSQVTGKAAGNSFYRGSNTGTSQQLCVNTASLSSDELDLTVFYDQY